MALQSSQIANLNALNQKIAGGYKASSQDLANLDYAKKQGYNYTPMASGATKITDPNYLKTSGLNESQLYRSGADIYKLPSVMPSDKITGTQAPIIQAVTPDPLSVDSLMAGIDTGNQGIQAQLDARDKVLQEETNLTELQKRQSYYTETQKTAQRDLQEQKWNEQGLNTNVAEVQRLMPQIAKTTAEFNSLQEQVGNSSGLTRIIGGTQDKLIRQKAIEVAGLSAVAQAYQGNVDMARNIANDAVNAQYQDQSNYFNSLNEQIKNSYTDLTAAEKKRADKLMIVNDERLRLIELEKETKSKISGLAITLANKGIDSSIVNSVLKAPSYEEAIRLASQSGGLETVGGLTDLGNGTYRNTVTGNIGTIDEIKQEQNLAQGIVSTSTGDSYDIKSYATDPTHETKIQSILNGIGQFKTIQDIDNYIQSNYPGSKVTGEMIANAAGKYGVSWEMMVAIMAQDSAMGTKGLGSRNNNPGNVGQFDSLGTKGVKGYATLQDGVNAVAKNLAWRKTTAPTVNTTSEITSTAKTIADAVIAGNAKLTDVPQKDRAAVIEEIQKSGQNVAELEQKLKTAESVKNSTLSLANDLLNSSVLPNATGMFYWTTKIPGTGAYTLGKKFDQLRDLLAMGNIDKLKGAMSDKDIEFLRNSATSLSLKLSPAAFKEELNAIKNRLQNPTSSVGSEVSTGTSGVTSSGVGYTIE